MTTAGREQADECNALRGSQKEQMAEEFAANAELAQLQRRVEKADDANRMLRFVIESAVARRDFMIAPTEENLAKIHGIGQRLLAQADTTKAKMQRQVNIEQVESVVAATRTYLDLLDKYAEGRKKQSREAEIMVTTASDFVAECEAIRADQKRQLAQAEADALDERGDGPTRQGRRCQSLDQVRAVAPNPGKELHASRG
jgi:methyl-accepting chemotaxis protein